MDCGRRDVSKKAEMILEDKKVSNIYSSHSVGMVWMGTFGITPQQAPNQKKHYRKAERSFAPAFRKGMASGLHLR